MHFGFLSHPDVVQCLTVFLVQFHFCLSSSLLRMADTMPEFLEQRVNLV
ncbi:Uncharacterised protein [Vibrio cholerae]|nr:Uncharacterised protein [Vibrio cholerae]CSB26326.1 Uncharacterised protein [Vibrio cholerae]CSI47762.1 Uncharacterised protein [Vibrio cholerae]